jgi:hypothetical protein
MKFTVTEIVSYFVAFCIFAHIAKVWVVNCLFTIFDALRGMSLIALESIGIIDKKKY